MMVNSAVRVPVLVFLGIIFIATYAAMVAFWGAMYGVLMLGIGLLLWAPLRGRLAPGSVADSHIMGIMYGLIGVVIVLVSGLALIVGMLAS